MVLLIILCTIRVNCYDITGYGSEDLWDVPLCFGDDEYPNPNVTVDKIMNTHYTKTLGLNAFFDVIIESGHKCQVPFDEVIWPDNDVFYFPKATSPNYPGRYVKMTWDRFSFDATGFCNYDYTFDNTLGLEGKLLNYTEFDPDVIDGICGFILYFEIDYESCGKRCDKEYKEIRLFTHTDEKYEKVVKPPPKYDEGIASETCTYIFYLELYDKIFTISNAMFWYY